MKVEIGHTGGLDYKLGDDGQYHLVPIEGDLTTVLNITNDDSAEQNFAAIERALRAYHLAPDSIIKWVDCPDAKLQNLIMGMAGDGDGAGKVAKQAPATWGRAEVSTQEVQESQVSASVPAHPEADDDTQPQGEGEPKKSKKQTSKKAENE